MRVRTREQKNTKLVGEGRRDHRGFVGGGGYDQNTLYEAFF